MARLLFNHIYRKRNIKKFKFIILLENISYIIIQLRHSSLTTMRLDSQKFDDVRRIRVESIYAA